MGPIGVKKHLAPFLPSHPVVGAYPIAKISFNSILNFDLTTAKILDITVLLCVIAVFTALLILSWILCSVPTFFYIPPHETYDCFCFAPMKNSV